MRALIQRVSSASVVINDVVFNEIQKGFLILIGIEQGDNQDDVNYLVQKIIHMRIFSDEEAKMNLSIQDVKGEFLVISQFTLHAQTKKGNRPSFIQAAQPEKAIPLYEIFCESLKINSNLRVKTGKFGSDMKVALVNDGPFTLMLDSKNKE
jgi:D-tyrosyl-tRNA(Tyr) deacylase